MKRFKSHIAESNLNEAMCSCCDNKIDNEGKCGCGPDCKHCGGQHDVNEDYRITKIYNPTTKKSRAAGQSTATFAVHTHDRKYFKEFPNRSDAEKHHAELTKQKKESVEIDEMDFSIKSLTKSGLSNVKKANNMDKTKKDLEAMRKRVGGTKSPRALKAGYACEETELDEAIMSGEEKKAHEDGKKAARAGKEYKSNPHKDSKMKLAWSKGHNVARANKLRNEEAELDEDTHGIIRYPDTAISYVKKKGNDWHHIYDKSYGFKGKVDKKDLKHMSPIDKNKVPKRLHNEEVELDEAMDQRKFSAGAKAMKAYAQKYGGVDKKDFMEVSKLLDQIGRVNILQAGQLLTRLNRLVDGMDTDVRERMFIELKKVGLVESAELEEQKTPFIVVDTADGNKVVGMASDERNAKMTISSAERPPMSIKDKSTLKIVKSRKKQNIGRPLVEEVELDEATINDIAAAYINENNISMQELNNMNEEELNELIGKALATTFKVGAKTAVGAFRGAKALKKRASVAGRADAAEKRADNAEKRAAAQDQKAKDRQRIRDAQQRVRDAKAKRSENNK